MKRRAEETVKTADTSGGYPHSSSPLSPPPPRHPPRTLTSNQVGQSAYAPAIKTTSELRSVPSQPPGFSTFPTTMPTVAPSIKGGHPTGTTGNKPGIFLSTWKITKKFSVSNNL
ncbi:hypothetical protein J6590_079583 [Homalodisca vitripennis]|nr:hypothetical protein J6590_079583 [Homalodisca vitripennis]